MSMQTNAWATFFIVSIFLQVLVIKNVVVLYNFLMWCQPVGVLNAVFKRYLPSLPLQNLLHEIVGLAAQKDATQSVKNKVAQAPKQQAA